MRRIDREFYYFDDTWNEFIEQAKTMGYHLYQHTKLGNMRPMAIEKNDIKILINHSESHYISMRIDSPFHWSESFDIRKYKLEFVNKAKEEILKTLQLLQDENWFHQMKLFNDICGKFGTLRDLNLEELKELDREKLMALNHSLEFLKIK